MGRSISDVIAEYRNRPDEFLQYWSQNYPQYQKEHADLIFGIGQLLVDGLEFKYNDFIYQIISENK